MLRLIRFEAGSALTESRPDGIQLLLEIIIGRLIDGWHKRAQDPGGRKCVGIPGPCLPVRTPHAPASERHRRAPVRTRRALQVQRGQHLGTERHRRFPVRTSRSRSIRMPHPARRSRSVTAHADECADEYAKAHANARATCVA